MFKRILIPLDGSTRAESAIPVAARIARAYGASITLLRVVETPVELWFPPDSPGKLCEGGYQCRSRQGDKLPGNGGKSGGAGGY